MPIIPLKNLLKGAVSRARISRQVNAREILLFVNDALRRLVPLDRSQDAKAVSYKEGVITIYVLHSAARHVLAQCEPDLLRKVKEAFPEKTVTSFSIRISKQFPIGDL